MSGPNGSRSPAGDRHPGQILHVDRADGRRWTESAADVPQSVAWVNLNGTWRPVVRVEAIGDKHRLELMKYGPEGVFLETTLMVAPPSPPISDPGPQPSPSPGPDRT